MISNNKTVAYSTDALRYAQALLELEIDKDTVANIYETFSKVPQLYDTFVNPTLYDDDKKHIVDRVFDDTLSKNFLKTLVSKGDCPLLFEILEACKHLILLQNRTLKAELVYSTPPDNAQLDAMEKVLCKKHNCKKILWHKTKSDDIIGGFVLHIDGTEYDYSMNSRLKKLKDNLAGR